MNLRNKIFTLLLGISIFIGNNTLLAEDTKSSDIYKDKIETISVFTNKIPNNIRFDEKYKGGHPDILDYVFVQTRVANVRENPTTESNVITKYGYGQKLRVLEKVKYKGNIWYKILLNNGSTGYISSNVVQKRVFRFQLALEKIKELEEFIEDAVANGEELYSTSTYVPNPNNENLQQDVDKYGTTADQNLKTASIATGEKIYVPDRSVLKVLSKGATTSRVKVLSIPDEVMVPNNRLTKIPSITPDFKKVVAIDTTNQNVMIFEKQNDGVWALISYVYSKTGITSALGFETPKGFFTAAFGRFVMQYNDENGQKQGTARYAIRFCGGGYIHGTPMNLQEEVNREFYMKHKEASLGTFSGTRKCIRTTEPHARFLFDWIIKNKNKNSNTQKIDEGVYFISF